MTKGGQSSMPMTTSQIGSGTSASKWSSASGTGGRLPELPQPSPPARPLFRAQAQALGVPRQSLADSAGQAGSTPSLPHWHDGRLVCPGHGAGRQRQGVRGRGGIGSCGGDALAETACTGSAGRLGRSPGRPTFVAGLCVIGRIKSRQFMPGPLHPVHRHDRRNVHSRRSGPFLQRHARSPRSCNVRSAARMHGSRTRTNRRFRCVRPAAG